jgi:hypothetical protein
MAAAYTLSSAGAGFVLKPSPVIIAVSAGFPLRTVLPGQKDPAIYARVSLQF